MATKARASSTSGWRYLDLIERWAAAGLVELTEYRGVPLVRTPLPPKAKGAWFDEPAVERVLRFFLLLKQLIGRWAGREFRLFDWQVEFLIAPVFGWKHPDGRRIFRTVWFEIPRKNGKSTVSSGLGLYLVAADREPGAQVFAAAGDRTQAGLVFEPAKQMAAGSPALAKATRRMRQIIEYPKTGSFFRVLSSDGDRQHGLNVHGAVIDEVHVHKKRDLIDALETGTGSREQPLVVFITTADDGDQSSIYAEKRDYLEQVARGDIKDASFYGVVFGAAETDDPFAHETIAGANPGAGLTVGWDYLHQKAEEAKSSPGALNRYLRLHLNVRTRATTRWIDPAVWDANAGMVDEAKLVGRDCYGGVDLASTSDFTAWLLLFPDVDGKAQVVARFFLPEAALQRRRDIRSTLEAWRRDGWLTVTPGDVIDQSAVRRQMEADAARFNVLQVAYDPWNSGFVPELSDAGMVIWPLTQTTAKLNAPSKELERLLGGRLIEHGGNPILRWMAGNVQVTSDSAGNIRPDRKKSTEKIDGIAALVDAIAAWQQGAEEKGVVNLW